MEKLLSFPSARKVCAALVAVLTVIENILAAPVWIVLKWRSRIEDALENSTGGSGHE